MDAFIVAGGVPKPGDPLFPYTRGGPRALMDIAGRPMIQWVVDALDGARLIDRIAVIGLEAGIVLDCRKPLSFHSGGRTLVENVMIGRDAVKELNPRAANAVLATADIPALTPEAVDWLVSVTMDGAREVEYVVVRREVMDGAFPGAKRSFVPMKDGDVCGASLHVVEVGRDVSRDPTWEMMSRGRKNYLEQFRLFGIGLLAKLLFRRLTIEEAVVRISRRLNVTGRALISPYADLAMDADKPHQVEMLKAHLAKKKNLRERPGAAI